MAAGAVRRLLLLLAMPLLLGASKDKWTRLADNDIAFARKLTAAEVRFGPQFISEVIADRIYPHGCKVLESRLVPLSNAQKTQVGWYSEDYCYPWGDHWARVLQKCRGPFAPEWCNKQDYEQDITRHLDISAYIDRLTSELDSERGALLRYNIMAVVADRLTTWPLFDFHPSHSVCRLLPKTLAAYLKDAAPDDALMVAEQLGVCTKNPEMAEQFRDYRDRSGTLTDEQRAYLGEAVQYFEAGNAGHPHWVKLHERYGYGFFPPEPKSSPAPANRTNPDDITLLLSRVETHFVLQRDRKVSELYYQLSALSRDMREKSAFERDWKDILKGSDILAWEVVSVRVSGDVALVTSKVTRKTLHGSGKGRISEGEDRTLWQFENGSWFEVRYTWPLDERKAVEVPLPQKQ